MMKQTTAVQRCMTAAMLGEEQHKARSYPALSQGKATDRLETRGKEGAQTSRGVWGRGAKIGVERLCQAPRAVRASAGHVNGLPGQLS